VPLLSENKVDYNHSIRSFKTLFRSLGDINLERETHSNKDKSGAKDITLIIPNANLTPPGEWRYDDTPLQSHDWSVGCQRINFADGLQSINAKDRLKAFDKKKKNASNASHFGEFVDLIPSRGTAAIIGVLSVKDCQNEDDLHRAEVELKRWKERFTPILYAQKYWEEAFDSPMAPKHFVEKRLFVFDSFDEDNVIDLSKSKMRSGELVAFPPTENMDLHLNVVVNDLAVSIFMNLEKRIRVLDEMNDEKFGVAAGKKDDDKPGIGDVANLVSPDGTFDIPTASESEKDETGEEANQMNDQNPSPHGQNKGKINWRNMAANAVKALNKNHNTLVDDAHESLPPIENELQTIIDTTFDETRLTAKDIANIFRRNEARRFKHSADLALMAGSAMDAYDRFARAAELLKRAYDPLWYAASLEGIATSFVAMADTGGHGADQYLEKNFQYPKQVMYAATSVLGSSEEGKETSKVDRSKTTMPAAICALLEESSSILSRNVKLASIYSELLLKMAWYISELEGLHLRCLWGVGFSGGDDHDDAEGHAMTAAISGEQYRWKMTSVSKIDLEELQKRGKLDPILCTYTTEQCLRFSDIMHRCVSNGGLDAFSRACVAARCAKLCLFGVKVPSWVFTTSKKKSSERLRLPRKAAFFTVIAAESMSQCKLPDARISSAGYWAAATHLYANNGNKSGGNNSYAWANLRVSILHGLSVYGGSIASEKALERMILLLGECALKIKPTVGKSQSNEEVNSVVSAKPSSAPEFAPDSPDKIIKLDLPRKQDTRTKNGNIPARKLFTSQNVSPAMVEQSKWIEDDSIPLILLPLIEPSTMVAIQKGDTGEIKMLKKINKSYRVLSSLLYLNCVPGRIHLEECVTAQQRCISMLANLRKTIPTISQDKTFITDTGSNDSISLSEQAFLFASTPLKVVSANIIKSESHLLLDKLKAAGYSGETTGTSLKTFFNPYANKKKASMGKKLITLVAQGEERTIVVEFRNCLSVPLVVPNCQLTFDKSSNTDVDVEASALSFTLPPKVDRYAVHFPFTVVSLDENPSTTKTEDVVEADENNKQQLFSFGVVGIRVSIFNRSFFIPFHSGNDVETKDLSRNSLVKQIPDAISLCQPSSSLKQYSQRFSVKLEAVKRMPSLLISFAESPTPIEDGATVPVHLSDGEILTSPQLRFRLENDFGGKGSLERLQILGVGLPGLPEDILFDTDELAKALEAEEDRFSDDDTDTEDFEELMESDGLPPLKMKCLAEGLSLESINDDSKSLGEGSIVSFQVAATHDMGNRLINGGNVRIRFRYRGPSPITGIEIWRKREIGLKIVRVKGPRISSLTFRSDLSWGSAFSDLCWSLALRRKKRIKTLPDVSASAGENALSEIIIPASEQDGLLSDSTTAAQNGVFIARDDIVVLMAVANETNSKIILSNRAGVVGGFESSPMPTVKVSSGVSVKIPVVIPRVDFLDENGDMVDIANELIVHTALKWESDTSENIESLHKDVRQGRVRIPSKCLREMIQEHQAFATRICKPPVVIELKVDGIDAVRSGHPIELFMEVQFKDSEYHTATLEFCCARRNSGTNAQKFKVQNKDSYIWCGQTHKTFLIEESSLNHHARLCIVSPGDYVLSGCVKLTSKGFEKEEVWWAPFYKNVTV